MILFLNRKKFYLVKEPRRIKNIRLQSILFVALLFVALLIYVINYFSEKNSHGFFTYVYNYHTFDTRLLLWKNTLGIIKEHFFLGVGTNNWQIWFPKEGLAKFGEGVSNGIETYQRPHNDFLWVFSESGVAGFVFFVLIFLLPIRYCFRLIRSKERSPKSYVLFVATLIGYAIISFVDFPLERIEHNVIFFSILALVATDNYRWANRENKKGETKKYQIAFLIIAPALIMMVSCCRFSGEYHAHKLIEAHHRQDWNKMITEKNKAKNVFYTMDFFSAPLSWYSGVAYFNLDKLSLATTEFEAARLVHPYNIHVLNNLASCYEKNNRHAEAIDLYKKALEISPGFSESLLNLSGAYYNSGNIESAFKTIDRCDFDSTDTKYLTFLGAILQRKGVPLEKFISLKKKNPQSTP
jgi:hypothetical protein